MSCYFGPISLGIRLFRFGGNFPVLFYPNLVPVLSQLHSKCASWNLLLLNLLCCINLLKIIFLLKFLYMFRNCQIWIPAYFFLETDRCVGTFILGGALPRLAKSSLVLLVRCRGLALPDYRNYYWVAILVTVCGGLCSLVPMQLCVWRCLFLGHSRSWATWSIGIVGLMLAFCFLLKQE